MNGGKKRSGFQITSVTSDLKQSPTGRSSPSMILTVLQSDSSSSHSPQRCSSQPTTPCLNRKYISQDILGQGAGCSSRFRVVKLAGGGPSSGGRSECYCRGRWTCSEFMERQEGTSIRRVMDSLRHAHSLESLEMIGRNRERVEVHSQDTCHLLPQADRGLEGEVLVLHSGPPSLKHRDPINVQFLEMREPVRMKGSDSIPLPSSARPHNLPGPLKLETDAAGRSVLRLSHSLPSSPHSGVNHPTLSPIQTPSAFRLDQTMFDLPGDASLSGNSPLGIDSKIEQAMDLVKSHLMLAVREEVELLKEQIRELQERNNQLERENHILRALTHKIYKT
ncbi:TSC22 domain family protein 4 [Xenentodon cancila]